MPPRKRQTAKRAFKEPTAEDMFLDYVATGRADLVEEYLDNNMTANIVNIRNCKGETVLHIAAALHQNGILEQLLPFFSEDELDIRDMYGLPAYMTAIKHGNPVGATIISRYRKSIETKPYRFRDYSFNKKAAKKSAKKQAKKPAKKPANKSLKNIINGLSPSAANPVINPINIWSYIPTRQVKNKSPQLNVYNNRNTRTIVIANDKKGKKRQTKKKQAYHIIRLNKN